MCFDPKLLNNSHVAETLLNKEQRETYTKGNKRIKWSWVLQRKSRGERCGTTDQMPHHRPHRSQERLYKSICERKAGVMGENGTNRRRKCGQRCRKCSAHVQGGAVHRLGGTCSAQVPGSAVQRYKGTAGQGGLDMEGS